jgi:hypothetical protein
LGICWPIVATHTHANFLAIVHAVKTIGIAAASTEEEQFAPLAESIEIPTHL